ncbi:MAG TPA: alpha/beta hydrolase [Acidimicrobiales bacterium]|jgi:pimeloyl-ACP methyl ester carboxylesterase
MPAGSTVELHAGGLTFPALAAGPEDGELVLLLHGFPQTAGAWRPQLDGLAAAGYRAVAPTQRGYAASARPPGGRRAYRLPALVDDVLGMARHLGRDRFSVVGHDWGGAVAWALAAHHPERLRTVAVVSTPHPRAVRESLGRSLQALRSSYVGFFALPALPEAVLLAGGGAVLRRMLVGSGLPADRADEYVAAMREPGALSGALGWYRAARPGDLALGDVSVPTLYVWSPGDPALGGTAARRTAAHVTGPYRFEVLEGAPHWIPETRPGELTRLLVDHLGSR